MRLRNIKIVTNCTKIFLIISIVLPVFMLAELIELGEGAAVPVSEAVL